MPVSFPTPVQGKNVCNQRWTYSEDEVIFLASLLENQLCGNTGLVKYQLMTCESCISIVLMWNFFPFFFLFFLLPGLTKIQLCKLFLCLPWKLFCSRFPLLCVTHTTASSSTTKLYYNSQLTTALKAYLSTAERLSTCCLERQRVLGNLLLCRKQLEKMPIIIVGKKIFFKNAFNKRIVHVYVLYVSETFSFAIKLLNMLLQEAQWATK